MAPHPDFSYSKPSVTKKMETHFGYLFGGCDTQYQSPDCKKLFINSDKLLQKSQFVGNMSGNVRKNASLFMVINMFPFFPNIFLTCSHVPTYLWLLTFYWHVPSVFPTFLHFTVPVSLQDCGSEEHNVCGPEAQARDWHLGWKGGDCSPRIYGIHAGYIPGWLWDNVNH